MISFGVIHYGQKGQQDEDKKELIVVRPPAPEMDDETAESKVSGLGLLLSFAVRAPNRATMRQWELMCDLDDGCGDLLPFLLTFETCFLCVHVLLWLCALCPSH